MNQFYAAEENISCGRQAYFRHIRIMQMHAVHPNSHPVYLHPDQVRLPEYFRRPSLQLVDQAAWPRQHVNAPHPVRPGPAARVYPLTDTGSVSAPGRPAHLNRQGENRRIKAAVPKMHSGKEEGQAQERVAGHSPPPRHHSPDPPNGDRNRQVASEPPHRKDFGLVYCKRFDEPGLYFRLPFGPFASEFKDQMEASQNMEPSQPVDCLVQVYDRHRLISAAQIAQAETGDADRAFEFLPLTPHKARLLGMLPTSSGQRSGPRRIPTNGGPNQPLFRLQILSDPSGTTEAAYAGPGSPSPPDINKNDRQIHQGL